jgi:hypothetical protein
VNNFTKFKVDQRGNLLRGRPLKSQTPATSVTKTTVKPIKKNNQRASRFKDVVKRADKYYAQVQPSKVDAPLKTDVA